MSGRTKFLTKHNREGVIGTLPAEFRVVFQPEHSNLRELREEFVRGEDPGGLPLVNIRVDLRFDDRAD